jgi:hypothetical protein
MQMKVSTESLFDTGSVKVGRKPVAGKKEQRVMRCSFLLLSGK